MTGQKTPFRSRKPKGAEKRADSECCHLPICAIASGSAFSLISFKYSLSNGDCMLWNGLQGASALPLEEIITPYCRITERIAAIENLFFAEWAVCCAGFSSGIRVNKNQI